MHWRQKAAVLLQPLLLSAAFASFSSATPSQLFESSQDVGSLLLNTKFVSDHSKTMGLPRSLQTQKTVCNTILASWTPEEVSTNFFNALAALGSTDITLLLEATLQPLLVYGVQIRTVCASCREILARLDSTTAASLYDICGQDVYGENATYSGLVMFPLTSDGSKLASGAMKGVVYCHGTRTDTWPSTDYEGPNSTSVEILQFAALASLGGSVIVIPDYMGFGTSSGSIDKAYTVLKSYQTSSIPIWYQAQHVLAQESNCTSVLSNQAALVGYSEGGYASVAVAQALARVGVQIIHVDSGGGPFRVVLSILSIIQGIDSGTFQLYERYIFAIIGSAYSGTYPLPNSNDTSQYVLTTTDRDTLVTLLRGSASSNTLNVQVPSSDPLSVFNQQLVSLARGAIAAGNFEPCSNNSSDFRTLVGELCDALSLNDLTNYLETQVNYPVRLCHSPQDSLVSYANLPNVSRNSQYLSLLTGATGSHQEGALYCVFQAFFYLISPDFQMYAVSAEAQSNGCSAPAPTSSQPSSSTVAPNSSPTTGLPTSLSRKTASSSNGEHALVTKYALVIPTFLYLVLLSSI